MYIIALESISTAYYINPSQQSECPYVNPATVTRQGLGKLVPAANCNNRRIFGRFVFYAVPSCAATQEFRSIL
jgi:hypothetical protein